MTLLNVLLYLLAGASCQDNGEKAAKLLPLVNGTLPNSIWFDAAARRIDSDASQGIISSWPSVSVFNTAYPSLQALPDQPLTVF